MQCEFVGLANVLCKLLNVSLHAHANHALIKMSACIRRFARPGALTGRTSWDPHQDPIAQFFRGLWYEKEELQVTSESTFMIGWRAGLTQHVGSGVDSACAPVLEYPYPYILLFPSFVAAMAIPSGRAVRPL